MALTTKQREFLNALQSRRFRYLLFGGAVSGGKTILTLGILHNLALDYPQSRWAVIRKNYTTIKRNTVPSLRKVAELDNTADLVTIKAESAVYANGSEVIFVDADVSKDPDLNKLKGLEVSGALMEEANECAESVFNILITRIGRWNVFEDYIIPQFILLTCNPANNWVKDKFYTPYAEGIIEPPYYFLQALPTDNQYNTEEYLESLKDLPETEYERYAKGNWDFADDPNQLISFEWYKNCISSDLQCSKNDRIILAIDPAREGDDKSIFCFMAGNKIYEFKEFSKVDTTNLGNLAIAEMQNRGIKPTDVIIDTVGVGGGVYDTMKARGYQPRSFVGGSNAESTPDFFTFANKRAEAFWLLREAIRNGEVEIVQNKKAQNDCLGIRYATDEKKISIEKKDNIKKRLGKSPDYADAMSMAVWLARSSVQALPQFFML